MAKFIVRKLAIMILTVFIISFVVFYIITLPPGDFIDVYISQMLTGGEQIDWTFIAELREQYGLDQPFIVQYWKWISNIIFKGDFGYSFALGMSVTNIIKAYIGPTMSISLIAMAVQYLIAIPIGVYSAVHQYSVGDYIFTTIGFIGVAIPHFLLAILLMYISYLWTGDTMLGLHSTKYLGVTTITWPYIVDLLKHCIIPITVIGLGGTCGTIRTMRGQMLDEIGRNYVLNAKSKGMSSGAIRWKYCFRAALNPIISGIGWSLVGIFTGSQVTAIVLNLPSMGKVMYDALVGQDMYLAGSWLFLMAIMTVIGTLISDVLLAWQDPRVRSEFLK